jgi:error-prone DNA polymerase
MPDPPPYSPRRVALSRRGGEFWADERAPWGRYRYAELHCRTNFSFQEGASHPDELVAEAHRIGLSALAITDHNTLAGVVRAHTAAKQVGLKILIGAEISLVDAPSVVLLATDRAAYGRLARLITVGRRAAPKGECRLTFDDLAAHSEGLIAGILDAPQLANLPPSEPADETSKRFRIHAEGARELAAVNRYRDLFGDRCYLFTELHYGPRDEQLLAAAQQLSQQSGVPLVAANGVCFHAPSRRPLYDILTAVRAGTTVAASAELLQPNAERYLKSPEQMHALFAAAPDAVQRTLEIAECCTFSLDELKYEYPQELAPPGMTPLEHLKQLTWAGAHQRYPRGIPPRIRGLIEHELALIEELQYEAYFLTVWDLARFARERQILYQGRGSAANSVVCYCLQVTAVDPDRQSVLFERFISRERQEAPDIDIDFEHERREEVLQYIYDKYGRERAGMTAEVISYRPRSAVRDVGKALGLSLDRVDALAKTVDGHGDVPGLAEVCRMTGLAPESDVGRQLIEYVGELIHFPRHLGQHVGGMVMTRGPLCELVPIENAAMDGRTVVEWSKDDLDDLGILKVDVLALGMLTAIRKCFDLIEQHTGQKLTLASIPEGDEATYDMICQADTMGVFQIESRAQMSMLPRLKPRCFYDLVIEVSIVRPGPIQGDMVHPYLRRRAGLEEVTYPSDVVRSVLEKTLGVPLFQEQAMQLAIVAAGFTPGEADQLRRAMGSWRKTGCIELLERKLIDGMTSRGLSQEFAARVFEQIRGFGSYGFPESHAASFALLVYASAWLKCHFPAAFCAAIINSQPMGFYAPAQLVRNARERGVEVRPIDVNFSDVNCTLEKNEKGEFAVRLGLRLINGLPEAQKERIVMARKDGPFTSLADFTKRTGAGRAVLARLAEADAFGSLKLSRRQSLWQAMSKEKQPRNQPLFAELDDDEELPANLPEISLQEEVYADYRATGLSLKAHPLSFYRDELTALGVLPAAELGLHNDGERVRVAGLVLIRQRPGTAKGITFVTLEDETGVANLIVRQEVWRQYYRAARTAPAILAEGNLQIHQGIVHVLVTKLESVGGQLKTYHSQSRDFR